MVSTRPNILLIVVDTLRADHLSTYEYFRETDPALSRLAEEGVVFEDFYASAIATGLAFTSILTGRKPITTGYYANPWDVPNGPQLDDDIPTMAESFQAAGYCTVAVDNLINFRSHPKQFVRGYEYLLNPTESPDWAEHHHVRGDEVTARIRSWLNTHRQEPFFLFAHYWDPHLPYNQPDEYRNLWEPTATADSRSDEKDDGMADEKDDEKDDLPYPVHLADAGYEYVPGWGSRDDMITGKFEDTGYSIDRYDGEIRYVDDQIGTVLDHLTSLDILDDTVVVVMADHGEQLGQDGVWDHKALLETVTRVPLILRGPGLPAGKRVSGFAEHVDVLPTLLDLAGIDTLPSFEPDTPPTDATALDGQSLLPAIDGHTQRNPVVNETHTQRAIRTDEWRYIHDFATGNGQLYHVDADPMERLDLMAERPEKAAELRDELLGWIDSKTTERPDPLQVSLDE